MAAVIVNNVEVGFSINEHIGYRFDVTNFVHEGLNVIEVFFTPAGVYGEERAEESPVFVPHLHYPGEIPHRNYVRKTQSDFAWDWGPAYAPVGIYRDIRIEAFSLAAFETVMAFGTALSADLSTWELTVEAYLIAAAPITDGSLVLELEKDGQIFGTSVQVSLSPGENRVEATLDVGEVSLWWPHG